MWRHAALGELLTHGESFAFGRVAVLVAWVGRDPLHVLALLVRDEPGE